MPLDAELSRNHLGMLGVPQLGGHGGLKAMDERRGTDQIPISLLRDFDPRLQWSCPPYGPPAMGHRGPSVRRRNMTRAKPLCWGESVAHIAHTRTHPFSFLSDNRVPGCEAKRGGIHLKS